LRTAFKYYKTVATQSQYVLATFPNCVNSFAGYGVVYTAREILASFKSKEITMKQLIALIATAFAVTAFAQAPAPKKEEKKVEAKPAVTAPAPAASTPAKAEVKSEAKAPAKAETTKK
jgi:hypothetical protein